MYCSSCFICLHPRTHVRISTCGVTRLPHPRCGRELKEPRFGTSTRIGRIGFTVGREPNIPSSITAVQKSRWWYGNTWPALLRCLFYVRKVLWSLRGPQQIQLRMRTTLLLFTFSSKIFFDCCRRWCAAFCPTGWIEESMVSSSSQRPIFTKIRRIPRASQWPSPHGTLLRKWGN